MGADGHSVLVAEYLTEAEARALLSAAEVARELEERSNARTYGGEARDNVVAARLNERARTARDSVAGLLISLEVYAESRHAARALDAYREGPDASWPIADEPGDEAPA